MKKLITIIALCSIVACNKKESRKDCWTCSVTKTLFYHDGTITNYQGNAFDTCRLKEVEAQDLANSLSYGWRQTSKRGDMESQTCICNKK